MHEQQVNTNDGGMSSSNGKKFAFVLHCEYGELALPHRGALYDHVGMRNQQIHSLLMMTYGEGAKQFGSLGEENREGILWLLHQLTSEVAQATCLMMEVPQ